MDRPCQVCKVGTLHCRNPDAYGYRMVCDVCSNQENDAHGDEDGCCQMDWNNTEFKKKVEEQRTKDEEGRMII